MERVIIISGMLHVKVDPSCLKKGKWSCMRLKFEDNVIQIYGERIEQE